MTCWGVSMVRDEADIIEATVTQMLSQVDHVLVADNNSQDGTREILESLDVEVIDEPRIGYYQSERMSELAARAADNSAQWVVPFDADEWWYSPFGRIADVLAEHDGAVAAAEIYDHRPTGKDPDDANPIDRICWRTREHLPLHKVACRPRVDVTITQGNHGARYPSEQPLTGQLVVRHFPHRSVDQMIRKARNGSEAYAATDLPSEIGQHWRDWGRLSDEQIAEVFHRYYYIADPDTDGRLIYDPCTALL